MRKMVLIVDLYRQEGLCQKKVTHFVKVTHFREKGHNDCFSYQNVAPLDI